MVIYIQPQFASHVSKPPSPVCRNCRVFRNLPVCRNLPLCRNFIVKQDVITAGVRVVRYVAGQTSAVAAHELRVLKVAADINVESPSHVVVNGTQGHRHSGTSALRNIGIQEHRVFTCLKYIAKTKSPLSVIFRHHHPSLDRHH